MMRTLLLKEGPASKLRQNNLRAVAGNKQMAFLQRSNSRITAGIDWIKASHQTHLRALKIEEQIISKGAPESAVAARIQVEVL
jgi:hypothetical protein